MRQQPSSEELKRVAARFGKELLDLLDAVKDHVADARNGSWTTEARKLAIDAIDEVLYNGVKKNLPGAGSQSDGEDFGNAI